MVVLLQLGLATFLTIILTSSVGGRATDDRSNWNGKSFSTSVSTYSEDGKCVKDVVINGPGISDVFTVSCDSTSSNIFTTDSSFVYGNPEDEFALFSNSPGKLVILQHGECTLKVYKGMTTGVNTEMSAMLDNDCSTIKELMKEEIERIKIYWEEWNKNFTQQLSNSFPPGFPFYNEAQPPPQETGFPWNEGAEAGSSMWQNWLLKFKNKMQESFPPGFPFTKQNNSK